MSYTKFNLKQLFVSEVAGEVPNISLHNLGDVFLNIAESKLYIPVLRNNILELSSPGFYFKKINALISQSSVDNPEVSMIENTIGPIQFFRVSEGTYRGYFVTPYSETIVVKNPLVYISATKYATVNVSRGVVEILTYEYADNTWALADGILDNFFLELLSMEGITTNTKTHQPIPESSDIHSLELIESAGDFYIYMYCLTPVSVLPSDFTGFTFNDSYFAIQSAEIDTSNLYLVKLMLNYPVSVNKRGDLTISYDDSVDDLKFVNAEKLGSFENIPVTNSVPEQIPQILETSVHILSAVYSDEIHPEIHVDFDCELEELADIVYDVVVHVDGESVVLDTVEITNIEGLGRMIITLDEEVEITSDQAITITVYQQHLQLADGNYFEMITVYPVYNNFNVDEESIIDSIEVSAQDEILVTFQEEMTANEDLTEAVVVKVDGTIIEISTAVLDNSGEGGVGVLTITLAENAITSKTAVTLSLLGENIETAGSVEIENITDAEVTNELSFAATAITSAIAVASEDYTQAIITMIFDREMEENESVELIVAIGAEEATVESASIANNESGLGVLTIVLAPESTVLTTDTVTVDIPYGTIYDADDISLIAVESQAITNEVYLDPEVIAGYIDASKIILNFNQKLKTGSITGVTVSYSESATPVLTSAIISNVDNLGVLTIIPETFPTSLEDVTISIEADVIENFAETASLDEIVNAAVSNNVTEDAIVSSAVISLGNLVVVEFTKTLVSVAAEADIVVTADATPIDVTSKTIVDGKLHIQLDAETIITRDQEVLLYIEGATLLTNEDYYFSFIEDQAVTNDICQPNSIVDELQLSYDTLGDPSEGYYLDVLFNIPMKVKSDYTIGDLLTLTIDSGEVTPTAVAVTNTNGTNGKMRISVPDGIVYDKDSELELIINDFVLLDANNIVMEELTITEFTNNLRFNLSDFITTIQATDLHTIVLTTSQAIIAEEDILSKITIMSGEVELTPETANVSGEGPYLLTIEVEETINSLAEITLMFADAALTDQYNTYNQVTDDLEVENIITIGEDIIVTSVLDALPQILITFDRRLVENNNISSSIAVEVNNVPVIIDTAVVANGLTAGTIVVILNEAVVVEEGDDVTYSITESTILTESGFYLEAITDKQVTNNI